MEAKDILIRLLKKGHISEDEFKMIYDNLIPTIQWYREYPQQPMPDFQIWHGVNYPRTGDPISPSYQVTTTEIK